MSSSDEIRNLPICTEYIVDEKVQEHVVAHPEMFISEGGNIKRILKREAALSIRSLDLLIAEKEAKPKLVNLSEILKEE